MGVIYFFNEKNQPKFIKINDFPHYVERKSGPVTRGGGLGLTLREALKIPL